MWALRVDEQLSKFLDLLDQIGVDLLVLFCEDAPLLPEHLPDELAGGQLDIERG